MKTTTLLLSTFLFSQLLFAQMSVQERAIRTERAVKIGKELSQKLLQTLQKNLKTHMKKGGPLAAIKFCNLNASSLTSKVQNQFGSGVTVRRVTLKTRNRANTPTKMDKTMLETFKALSKLQTLPPYLMLEKKHSFTYYQPLIINKPVCLKCHGNIEKSSELASFLHEHYPEDQALGYKLKDLRGAIVVDIPNK